MNEQWSPKEKKAARRIFDLAAANARREILSRHESKELHTLEELWKYELEIREWRREIQIIFHYTYSHLELCFATGLRRGWLTKKNLSGLSGDRIDRIESITEAASM